MIVALSFPDWPSGGAATDLVATLLRIAPRAAVSPAERIAWVDGRGLDASALATRVANACAALTDVSDDPPRAGIATVPIVAAIAARQTLQPVLLIPPGHERRYLAPHPLAVLTPAPTLAALFDGVGLHRCGDLAALGRDAVEVRFGPQGLACWKFARADDPRLLFRPPSRERTVTSLDWTEFSTTDLEQLVFVLHAMLGTVCEQLDADGLGATRLMVFLTLEGGGRLERLVHSSRPTTQRLTWLRLIRRDFERLTLPDRVAGVALRVDATAPPQVRQGDLFDLGFGSAEAADAAIARILDLQSDAIVRPVRSAHPLPERRVRWVADLPESKRYQVRTLSDRPALQLRLLATPREVTVTTRDERDVSEPTHYLDNGVCHSLMMATTPQRIALEQSSESFARQYHQLLRADGAPVLIYRDEVTTHWYLAGWWE